MCLVLVLSRLADAPWLPAGGQADVVLSERDDPEPTPVSLVRLLVTDAEGRIFCVPRTGGRAGWDLPAAQAVDDGSTAAVAGLADEVLDRAVQTDLLGYVRNTVPDGTVYEWPSPVAYFLVHRVVGVPLPVIDGVWLAGPEAARELGERHWWPLVAVGHDAAVDMTDELIAAWGQWLERGDRDRDRLVAAATDALVLGIDTPALRELAGLYPHAVSSEIDDLVRQGAAELGLPVPTWEVAVRKEILKRARQVLTGQVAPPTLTSWAHRYIGHDRPSGWEALVRLDDEYGMLEEVRGYYEAPDRSERLEEIDQVVRAAAAAILDGETDLRRLMPTYWR